MLALLTREKSGKSGTFGRFVIQDFKCWSLELPWNNNNKNHSCIPCGLYHVYPFSSKKFGRVWKVDRVPQRDAILIHAGNFAGSVTDGLKSDTRGCILLGLERGVLAGQAAVLRSRDALEALREKSGAGVSFDLRIVDSVWGR